MSRNYNWNYYSFYTTGLSKTIHEKEISVKTSDGSGTLIFHYTMPILRHFKYIYKKILIHFMIFFMRINFLTIWPEFSERSRNQ